MGEAVEIRVRGRVQGVGFRPTIWRHARALGLDGDVRNDADGVLIRVAGPCARAEALVAALRDRPPPLARIDAIEMRKVADAPPPGFRIVESVAGPVHTQAAPDAVLCPECATEIADLTSRRYRYPFTNCTHCGPRLTILRGLPYDRAGTTMAPFAMCADCAREYADPADRRFHAEATGCPACGPRARFTDFAGRDLAPGGDPVAAAAARIATGEIVALKGLGGYQLACDATNEGAVALLRQRKRRDTKPFALMARDFDVIARYCEIAPAERAALAAPEGPIVLLPTRGPAILPANVAPSRDTLGFMLPTTPLHALLLSGFDRPLVMTSGNLTDEPQVIDDAEALDRLAAVADCVLAHDRAIAQRVDDSVVRVMAGRVRVIRRARGFAPEPIALPAGFESAPDLVTVGGELKSTFCLVKDGAAVLSQHQGDLEHEAAERAWRESLALYAGLLDHEPVAITADPHPEYLSTKYARARAESDGLALIEVQHHHAHAASCLAENGYPLSGPPVLAIVLDGLGYGPDGTLWGGELLACDYLGYERLASLLPVAMPGGAQAVREPWRNLYVHLAATFGWDSFLAAFGALDAARCLAAKPVGALEAMIARGINSPRSSSCGRLFDAVAASLGISFDSQSHEGEAASVLEALAGRAGPEAGTYPFAVVAGPMMRLDPAPMWRALLEDLAAGARRALVAARFHYGLACALADLAAKHAAARGSGTVALSGGCFQNRLLFETMEARLGAAGLAVLGHALVPANDGGLALGQAAVSAARLIAERTEPARRMASCASESLAVS